MDGPRWPRKSLKTSCSRERTIYWRLTEADLSTFTDYDDNGIFEFNTAYKNTLVKKDLMQMIIRPAESKKESDMEKLRSIEKDRKNVIQACVVRILQMRKTIMDHQLIVEILEQLSANFKHRVDMVKKWIGIHIKKEYTHRIKKSRDVNKYIV